MRGVRFSISLFFGIGLAVMFGLAVDLHRAEAQAITAAGVGSIYRGVDLNRVVVWTEAAGGYDTPRGFDPVLLDKGWHAWVDAKVRPEIAWMKSRGATRIRVLIHNPYGLERSTKGVTDEYRFSQRGNCYGNPATKTLAHGFADAVRPLTREGVEVITYFGRLDNDPLAHLAKSGKGGEYLDQCRWQIAEALEAGCSIAFDASNDLEPAGAAWRFMASIEPHTRIYLEPRPHATRPHLFGYPIITQDEFWARSDPEKHADSAWGARNVDLTGEVIRFVQFPDRDPAAAPFQSPWLGAGVADRLIAPAIRIQRDGHTAALTTSHIRRADR